MTIRTPVILLCAALLSTVDTVTSCCLAADAPATHQLIGRVWFPPDFEKRTFDYMRSVGAEFEIKSRMFDQQRLPPQFREETSATVRGNLIYLVRGLVPSMMSVEFRPFDDEKAFRKHMNQRKTMFGTNSEIIDHENGYELKVTFGRPRPVPPREKKDDADGDSDSKSEVEVQAVRVEVKVGGDDDDDSKPAAVSPISSLSFYYRYENGYCFETRQPGLFDIELPHPDTMVPSDDQASYDVFVELTPRDIPVGLKHVVWGMVQGAANTSLQQTDTERDDLYALRYSAGSSGLNVLKNAVFGVDELRASVRFANGDEPLRAELDIDAAAGSELSNALDKLNAGSTRFAALRDDPSALTVASSWSIPEPVAEMLKAISDLAKNELQLQLVTEPDLVLAIEEVAAMFSATEEPGRTDVIVQLAGDPESGFGMYGAFGVRNAPRFLELVTSILDRVKLNSDIQHSQTTDDDGRRYDSFRVGDLPFGQLLRPTDGGPPYLHLMATENTIWFSAGGDASLDLLQTAVSKAEEGRRLAANPSLVQIDIDLSRWLGSDDAVGSFEQFPQRSIEQLEEMFHNLMMQPFKRMSMVEDYLEADFRGSFMRRALEAGGDELHLEFRTDSSGVHARAELGSGLGKLITARMLDVQSRMMNAFEKRSKKQMEEVQKRLKIQREKAEELRKQAESKKKE